MKTKIKKAHFKATKPLFDIVSNIVTIVLEQDGIYFEPDNKDFLGVIYNKFVKDIIKDDNINILLSKRDIIFFHENSDLYMLNYIYNTLFCTQESPFDTIIYDEEEDEMFNLPNFYDKTQAQKLVQIIDTLNIDFKKLSKSTSLLTFPKSLDGYEDGKYIDFEYQDI